MTFDDFMKCGKVRSRTTAYQKKKEKAVNTCIEQLLTHKAPYVYISGGKDSVAMAFIVDEAARSAGKDFTLWSHISDASFPGTRETCESVSNRICRKLDIFEPECSAFDSVGNEKKSAFGKTGVFFDSVRAYAADKDLCFVGVRANESKRRMKAARSHGMVFHSKSMGDVDTVHPLQWFTIYDVAAALYEYDAPVHPIYRKLSVDTGNNSNGEPIFIRLGYITSKDLLDKGTAVFLKTNYPDKYNILMERFPEIRNYC